MSRGWYRYHLLTRDDCIQLDHEQYDLFSHTSLRGRVGNWLIPSTFHPWVDGWDNKHGAVEMWSQRDAQGRCTTQHALVRGNGLVSANWTLRVNPSSTTCVQPGHTHGQVMDGILSVPTQWSARSCQRRSAAIPRSILFGAHSQAPPGGFDSRVSQDDDQGALARARGIGLGRLLRDERTDRRRWQGYRLCEVAQSMEAGVSAWLPSRWLIPSRVACAYTHARILPRTYKRPKKPVK